MNKVIRAPKAATFKSYWLLTKPGIIFGNVVTTFSGFAMASHGHIDLMLLLTTICGLGFIIASGCVFNNYIDRRLDAKMQRTKNRALAAGSISLQMALLFAISLVLVGSCLLVIFVNLLTASLALTGFLIYVFFYSFIKYYSWHATLIGSIAGALPPVIGYSAKSGSLDFATLLLFLAVMFWQMPHFYAIALYRLNDYTLGAIPVLPLIKGITTTKRHINIYIGFFIVTMISYSFLGYATYFFGITMALLGLTWLWLSIKGFKKETHPRWARKMFIFSLVVVMAQSVLISFCSI